MALNSQPVLENQHPVPDSDSQDPLRRPPTIVAYPSITVAPSGEGIQQATGIPRVPRAKLFLPVELKDSMRFFQIPGRTRWWALVCLAVFGTGFFYAQGLGAVVSLLRYGWEADMSKTTPADFLVSNASIAITIPVAILCSYLFYHQGFGWLTSVVGRFRWKWFLISVAIVAVGYVVWHGMEILVQTPQGYGLMDLRILSTTLLMIVGILLTTPLQAAAEEYAMRGIVARLLTALVPQRRIGLVLSAVGTSLMFMFLHGAGDWWLRLDYFASGLLMWWVVYRTGGLEASIALHAVNNLFAAWMLPFTDISNMFDRSAGTGSWRVLIGIGVQIVLVLIIDWVARRKKIVRMSAPAADSPLVMAGGPFIPHVGDWTFEASAKELPRIATTARENQLP